MVEAEEPWFAPVCGEETFFAELTSAPAEPAILSTAG